MKRVSVFVVSCIIASVSLGFVSCENKAAKEAEAARIEQEKQEAIQQALEEQKAEMQKQELQAQEMRLQQQAEQENRVQEEQQNTSIAKFAGDYDFRGPDESGDLFIIHVLSDGRVLKDDEYVGVIKVISDNAFMIRPENRNTHFFPRDTYLHGEDHPYSYDYDAYIDRLVFDVKEKRAYCEGLEKYKYC